MAKWFRRSLMAVGVTFIAFIVGFFLAYPNETYTDNIGMVIILFSMLFTLTAVVTGIGALIQKLFRSKSEKAKRGLVYEDAMLNRIMKRLDDEERAYLHGYLNAQPYESVEGFDYYSEESSKQDHR